MYMMSVSSNKYSRSAVGSWWISGKSSPSPAVRTSSIRFEPGGARQHAFVRAFWPGLYPHTEDGGVVLFVGAREVRPSGNRAARGATEDQARHCGATAQRVSRV